MAVKTTWTPERIRKLRGDESRAAFAERLGVSPLTVYRWELPDDAAEARRPRGAIKQRLDQLAAGGRPSPRAEGPVKVDTPAGAAPPRAPAASPSVPFSPASPASPTPPLPAAEGPSPGELGELLPVLDRLLHGDFRRSENTLLSLLSSGRLRTPASRALATQAIARVQLWARADVRGAFTTLLPILTDADEGKLPPLVEAEVYVAAALVFGGLDGRIFDAGKLNAYVARAERLLPSGGAAGSRFLLWMAQATAAFVSNEPPLVRWVLARAGEVDQDPTSPLLRCHAEEMRAVGCYFGDRPQDAPRHIAEMVRLAAEGSFHYVTARFLAQLARQQSDDAVDPSEVLATVTRARALTVQARVVPGWHSLFLAYAAGEANLRLARLDEAEAALLEGIQSADELRWSSGSMPLFLARLYVLTGRGREVRAVADRALSMETAVFPEVMRRVAEAVQAIADALEDREPAAAVERLDEIARDVEGSGAWAFLRRTVLLANAALAVFAGDEEQAARAVRRAERTLDTVPSPWASAGARWLRGVLAHREGKLQEARALHEGALSTFGLAKDRVQEALVRWTLAHVLSDLGDAGAGEALSAADAALVALGVLARPRVTARRRRSQAARAALPADEGALRIAAPIQRLSVRGMGPELIHRELLAALHDLFAPATVRLEELDSRGGAVLLGEIGGSSAAASESAELGDGTGRRFRVSLAGRPPPDARTVLGAVASVAGLALEVATLRGYADRAAVKAPAADGEAPEIPGFVSASAVMRRLKADLLRLSRSRANIIVTGESGSGKEVVARALHDLSVRAARPYVAFNCAAVPRELFEGQLFGYRKGAFTGAVADQPGVIRAADSGTLFLDEIGELPLDVQPKLLRFLENGEIFPLGERRPVHVDVRVIAATFRDLEKLVRDGRFREDLFYRLQVVPVRVPPLRERPEDVIALARHFLQRFTPEGQEPPVLAPDAIAALTAHAWPGNVRELRNVVERLLAFEPVPPVLGAAHLRFG